MLVPSVLDGAINYLRSGATDFHAEAKTILELGERYPGDAGVLAAMLLLALGAADDDIVADYARTEPVYRLDDDLLAKLPAGTRVGNVDIAGGRVVVHLAR